MGRSPDSPYSFQNHPCSTPIEQACEAMEEDRPPARRKSSTWKNFNLKRQLSRVDIKIKNPLKDKRNSVFYPPEESPTSEEGVETPDSEENTIVLDEQIDDSNELQFSADEECTTPPFSVGSLPETQKRVAFVERPDNLELLDDDGSPVRPPRGRKKVAEKRDQRLLSVPNIKYHKSDDRQCLKDLRDKEEVIVSPQPSFTGNLMRRLSKLLQLLWKF